jgi:Zn-dependent protease
MFRSWRVGTAFGIGIFIHPTFWLLPLMVAFQTWSNPPPATVGICMVLLVATMACVVLHELGHALTARYYGIRTRHITLYPIGGVAALERLPERPVGELLLALAGPAVNVVLALLLAVFMFIGWAAGGLEMSFSSRPGFFLWSLLATNVVLFVFNLIPALPMDGGRVLRALLAIPLGRLRATEIAAKVAVACALGIGALYLVLGNPMLIFIAVFVLFVGQQELAVVRRQEQMRMEEPLDVLPAAEPVFYDVTGQPIQAGYSGFLWDARIRAWVLWHNGRPVATYAVGPE